MKLEVLKSLLEVNERKELYLKILAEFEEFGKLENFFYKSYDTREGIIPIILISKNLDVKNVKKVKIFLGAQHNEYNGLFGILKFLRMIKAQKIKIDEILINNQVLIFAPLMNPYGFQRPSKHNKSGYFLRNGSNLNRFWRRTFAPEYKDLKNDGANFDIPEHCKLFKDLLNEYWKNEEIPIFLIDFHETSLLERFPRELSKDLSIYYKFDHWLKEFVVLNIISLYGIKYYRKPLFYKCNANADHTHINLSMKQVDMVFEKLLDYMVKNEGKLAFYFCYGNVSKDICIKLADTVYNNLRTQNILWETFSPAYSHYFHDHGCFAKMSDATTRKNIFTMELESQKQFFDLFEEIEKSKNDPNYYDKKLNLINYSIDLVIEAITQMIKLF